MLANCVCVYGCARPYGPKPCQVFGQSVCQSAISMPIVNRQRQSMRQSVRQLVTYSMRDAAVLIHLICERTFMRCCLMRCAHNVGNAFFLLLASIKIQIQHDACQGNKPTIYTQAPRPPQCGEGGREVAGIPPLPAGRETHQAMPTIKLRNFSIYA